MIEGPVLKCDIRLPQCWYGQLDPRYTDLPNRRHLRLALGLTSRGDVDCSQASFELAAQCLPLSARGLGKPARFVFWKTRVY